MRIWMVGALAFASMVACSGDEDSTATTGTAGAAGAGGTGQGGEAGSGASATGGTGTGTAGGSSVQHGDMYVIQGTGFGTKPTATPFLWDDFESGSDGAAVDGASPVYGATWSGWSSDGVDPAYGSSNPRHGRSSRHSFHDFDSISQYNCSLGNSLPAAPGDKVYFSYWWRYESTGTEWTANLKPWVIYNATGQSVVYVGMSVPGDGLRSGGDADSPTLWGSMGQETADAQWVRWEEELLVSAANQPNGARHCSVHFSSPEQIVSQWSSDAHQTHAGDDFDNIDLGTYQTQDSRSPGARCLIQIDDVYIDYTWARVELGDNADFDSCTHREIQVPTAWADGEVTITINQGSFASLAGLHLFVVGADRQVVHSEPL